MFDIYIYSLIFLILLTSSMVLITVNPIQSILFLILTFVFSSLFFLILGAEFLALLLLIVYVGAISILFLFVVMMLNLRLLEQVVDFYSYLPIGTFMGLLIFMVFYLISTNDFGSMFTHAFNIQYDLDFWVKYLFYRNNIIYFGMVFYNFFFHYLILAGIVLFVSMIGVIVLTVDFSYRNYSKIEFSHNILFLRSTNVYWLI